MPWGGLFIGIRNPQQQRFGKWTCAKLEADGQIVRGETTRDRNGGERRQCIATGIGAPEEKPRSHIISADKGGCECNMLWWRLRRRGRHQDVRLVECRHELLTEYYTGFHGAIIELGRHQGRGL
jgi:hypothetical protein